MLAMYADNQFLEAISNKLNEIADSCADLQTKTELNELIEKMVDQMLVQK